MHPCLFVYGGKDQLTLCTCMSCFTHLALLFPVVCPADAAVNMLEVVVWLVLQRGVNQLPATSVTELFLNHYLPKIGFKNNPKNVRSLIS